MIAKKIKTVVVERSDYKIFLKKAADLYDIMLKAHDSENWMAIGLNAVHCAISCSDAMLTFHLGIRSSGEDHMQAADLLTRLPASIQDKETSTFKKIVAKKNLIAYENREFRRQEALDILKLTERFYRWTTSKLPVL